jgi:hypothetical protein
MKIQIFLSFAFLALIYGCQNSPTTILQTGDLKGTVGLIDAHGNEVGNRGGVLVKVEGTSLSGVSDSSGNWVIRNLTVQTYSISFSKPGYGTFKNTSFSYLGGDSISFGPRAYLYQPVNFTIVLDSISANLDSTRQYDNYGYLSGHISGADEDSSTVEAIVLFGASPNIVFGDTTTYLGGLLWNNSRPISLKKKGSDFIFESKNWGVCAPDGCLKSGGKIYFQGFALSTKYAPRYFDTQTGKWVYPNPPAVSNILSITIP